LAFSNDFRLETAPFVRISVGNVWIERSKLSPWEKERGPQEIKVIPVYFSYRMVTHLPAITTHNNLICLVPSVVLLLLVPSMLLAIFSPFSVFS